MMKNILILIFLGFIATFCKFSPDRIEKENIVKIDSMRNLKTKIDSSILFGDYDFFENKGLMLFEADKIGSVNNYYTIHNLNSEHSINNSFDTSFNYKIYTIDKISFLVHENLHSKTIYKTIIVFYDNKLYRINTISGNEQHKEQSYFRELIEIDRDEKTKCKKIIFSSVNRIVVSDLSEIIRVLKDLSGKNIENDNRIIESYDFNILTEFNKLEFKGACKYKDEELKLHIEKFKKCFLVGDFKYSVWIFFGDGAFDEVKC